MSSGSIIPPSPRRQGILFSTTKILLRFAEFRRLESFVPSTLPTSPTISKSSSSSTLSARRANIPGPLDDDDDSTWKTMQRDNELAERRLRSLAKSAVSPGHSREDDDADIERIQRLLLDPRDEFPGPDDEAGDPSLKLDLVAAAEDACKVGIMRYWQEEVEADDEWDFCEDIPKSTEAKVREKRDLSPSMGRIKSFTCPMCGDGPMHRMFFDEHVRRLHGRLEGVVCGVCGKRYGDQYRLDAHAKIHAKKAC